MRRCYKIIVLLEVILCFAPMTLLLLIGLLLVPMQVYSLLSEPLTWEGPAYAIASVICGSAGLVALIYVLGKLFAPEETIRRPVTVLTGLVLGTLPLIDILVEGDALWRLMAAMPLACAAHVVFLSRRMLFPWVTV